MSYSLLCEFLNSFNKDGKYYTLTFFPVRLFIRDLSKYYRIKRISKIIHVSGFKIFGGSTIRIHRFFIPEFIYMLESLPKRSIYQKSIQLIKEHSWLKKGEMKTIQRVNTSLITQTLNVTLKQYQLDFIKEYDRKKQLYFLDGYILGFEQGLGKTITSLSLMESLKKDCIIIIAPKSTLENVWKNEIEKYYNIKKRVWIVNQDIPNDSDIYIFNYESLNKFSDVHKYISRKKNIGIIVDESHNFLHSTSKRTENLMIIKNITNTKDLLLMSGTPIKALGSEMIPVLSLLDPMFDEEAKKIFSEAFGLNTLFATEILKNRMGMIMYRKLKSEVLNLPKKYEKMVKIKIPNGDNYTLDNVKNQIIQYIQERQKFYSINKQKYENMFNEVIQFLTNKFKNDSDFHRYLSIIETLKVHGYASRDQKLVENIRWANIYEKKILYPILPPDLKKKFYQSKSVVKYVNLKIMGEVIGNLLGKLRAEMTSAMIKYSNIKNIINDSEKKSVIFTTFVQTVDACEKYFRSNGFHPLLAYGKTSKNINQILTEFKTDPGSNPLIATIPTLATGVTLVEANTVIFLNKPWRFTDYQQASDRVHRIGQDTEVFIYTFLLDTGSKPNLSEKMEEIMKWSEDMFAAIVGEDV